jgi:hypothetical protein
MNSEQSVILQPHEDCILSIAAVAKRWADIHPKVALKRVRQLGLPIIQFNARSLGVRLSDVLKAEREATV